MQVEGGPVGENVDPLEAGNGRYDSTRPGGHDGLVEAQAAISRFDLMLVQETSFPSQEFNRFLSPVEGAINRLVDAFNDRVLAGNGLIQVEANLALDFDPEFSCPPGNQVHDLGRME